MSDIPSPNEFKYIPHTLAETVDMMNSPNYKERFLAEYFQVWLRLEKLNAMLEKWDNDQLEFTPTCPQTVLIAQSNAMATYLTILHQRLQIEIPEFKEVVEILLKNFGQRDD